MQCSVGSTIKVLYRYSVRQPHAAHPRVGMSTKTIDKHAHTDSSAQKKKNPPQTFGYCTLDGAHVKLQLELRFYSNRQQYPRYLAGPVKFVPHLQLIKKKHDSLLWFCLCCSALLAMSILRWRSLRLSKQFLIAF